ncbi:hypothetical protein [Fluviispira vulneris]|uniref:hypothetical protein n=1 Tax=Fluviispira vulneris TaxID=2763012 RepID=UPI00164930FE|nr:hypothetical protein [Fluviispira vulneris]
MYLKSVVCALSSAVSFSVFAQTENSESKNIDLFASAGYSFTKNLKLKNDTFGTYKPDSSADFGAELSLSALYSLPSLGIVTPVIGGGLHSAYTANKIEKEKTEIYWASAEANAGVKFNPVSSLQVFTLANLGYAGISEISDKTDSSRLKNHYYYGATVIGTVPLTDAMSVGGSVAYNRHSAKYKDDDTSLSFNQFTTALVLQYSI